MSEIIRELSVNLLSKEDELQMTDMICHCWNIGGFPEGDTAELLWNTLIQPVISNCYSDPHHALANELRAITNKRRNLHADDSRFIINFELEPLGEYETHLNIRSILATPEQFFAVFLANDMSLHT
ncbi:hypothetical protein D5018_08900 [Parashewanella curva]|uniref:Uncharacterized protein n=1 Tax=Parashewanella curva TaxID=2338552 RepID=A0A3L8PXK2_9GAMM|nr:hypothetical protein [Parashewanella curva]RLV60024.1 hypothetical protein D5018_08900 [Parashewanella curva]